MDPHLQLYGWSPISSVVIICSAGHPKLNWQASLISKQAESIPRSRYGCCICPVIQGVHLSLLFPYNNMKFQESPPAPQKTQNFLLASIGELIPDYESFNV